MHKQKRIADGKKVTMSDKRYLQLAQESLYGELAISLNRNKEDVEEDVVERLKRNKLG